MRQELISLAQEARWRSALLGIPHGFAHTWDNCRAFSASHGSSVFLYSYTDATSRVVCPIMERRFGSRSDIATPFGFSGFVGVGAAADFGSSWFDFAREKKWVCGYIGLHPLFSRPELFQPVELNVQNETFWLNLQQEEAILYSNLSRCRKRQMKSWDKRVESWLCTDMDRLKPFIVENQAAFFENIGASQAYRFEDETWKLLLEAPNALIIGATVAGEVVAATIFCYSSYAADALFNISIPEGRDVATSLMWEGVRRLRDLGVPALNMGGGVRPGDTVAQSKLRFGATVRPLSCLKQIYDPPAFVELCQSVGVHPEDLSGYFPPYRRQSAAMQPTNSTSSKQSVMD